MLLSDGGLKGVKAVSRAGDWHSTTIKYQNLSFSSGQILPVLKVSVSDMWPFSSNFIKI